MSDTAPGSERPQARGRFQGMAARTVLATALVAIVSVLVSAVVAVPLIRQAATTQARNALQDQADLAASMLTVRTGRPEQVAQLSRLLRDNGIRISLVRDGSADRRWVPGRVITRVSAGKAVHTELNRGERQVLVEARPAGTHRGVVLAQAVTGSGSGPLAAGLALALAVGLVAGILAGILLARRLSRPVQRAARAAHRIRHGDRTARLPLDPPDEVRDLSRALNELTAALDVSERRQREFLMSVSHELRTPLTTIRGYAEALTDGVLSADEDTARDAGRTVLTEAHRLDRLVSDLLALARLQAVDFALDVREVDLAALADAALTAWRPTLTAAGMDARGGTPEHPVVVRTDPDRVRQILDILLENASRAAPGAPLLLALHHEGEHAAIQVRDGGPGLTDDDLVTAFDRGRLHNRYRGTRPVGSGLGLALAAQLAARLGGTITAEHAPEGGVQFTVRLPVAGPSDTR